MSGKFSHDFRMYVKTNDEDIYNSELEIFEKESAERAAKNTKNTENVDPDIGELFIDGKKFIVTFSLCINHKDRCIYYTMNFDIDEIEEIKKINKTDGYLIHKGIKVIFKKEDVSDRFGNHFDQI